ncbi:hypothetical protein [Paenibacillus piri]|uniref:Uncharacterized protein n=1 Tax=Paenibacillus piri TaxID=2547395 RepID=A0A4R5KNS9_9BACL|nr:hypothetical protein [Paenibacillus piri]TDF96605.1 hypothetical protein E1757_16040 [Paenibacillus piri]
MISNREIKGQIDELTEQNQFLTQELQEIKELIQSQSQQGQNQDQNQEQGSNQKQNQKQNRKQGQDQDQNQNQSQSSQSDPSTQSSQGDQQNQSNGSGQQSQDSGSSNQNTSSGGNQGNDLFQIAGDFLKLKGMIGGLEQKMKSYISNQASGKQLTEEDVINLMLSMMNGMIDWTVDYAYKQSGQNQSSGQLQ